MFHPLDIFKTGPDGTLLWRGTAESLATAKECIRKLALSSPGEYLVLNQRTGDRFDLSMPEGASETNLRRQTNLDRNELS